MPDGPQVLFVCVHNAGRSQMAAALMQRYAGGRIAVRSAGSTPAESLNPAVVDVMREIGIDLAGERPSLLTTEEVEASDVVVTMSCGDSCPVFPGKRYVDWQLRDPAGLSVAQVRPIRDEIDRLVHQLVDELLPKAPLNVKITNRAAGHP
ncbi:MAG TPA: arsenate reductase ArsC [Mycobacteriales bacterium]|nr:arsenate reductase ArsC [Mycobacteriales bacterium]